MNMLQNGRGNLEIHRHEAADGLAELLSNRAKLRQAQTQDGRKSRWQDSSGSFCVFVECRRTVRGTVEMVVCFGVMMELIRT